MDASGEQPFLVGTADEDIASFDADALPRSHRAMLVGHAAAPGRTLSAGETARCAGWDDLSSADFQDGELGARIAAAQASRCQSAARRNVLEVQTSSSVLAQRAPPTARVDDHSLHCAMGLAGGVGGSAGRGREPVTT